jgi:hypothetical protein
MDVPITDGCTVKCFDILIDKDGDSRKYYILCTDANPQSNCTPKEAVRNNSNNDDTISCILPTSGVKVEADTNSGENNSLRIPHKVKGLEH